MIEKTEAVEAQVNEVKVVMDQNIQSMMERGEKIEDLEHKTGKIVKLPINLLLIILYIEALTTGAEAFNRNTKIVTKKLWWKNIQATITFALVVLFIVVGLVIYFIYANKAK